MRQTLARLVKLTAGYSLVTLIGPIFTILLTPLYTRVLEPADYGVVDVSLTLSGLVGIFVGLGMDQALNSHFFDGDDRQRRNLVTTAVMTAGTFGIVAALVIVAAARPLAALLFNDPARNVTLWLLAIGLVSAPLYTISGAALRLRMGVRRVNALGLAYLFALIGLTILFVLGLRLKATGIVAAYGLANLTGASVGIALLWQPLRGRFDWQAMKLLVKTGIGLVPSILGLVLLNSVDRLMLTQYVTPEQLGLYSIANKLASMLIVAINAAITAWVPMAIEMASRQDAPQQYARMYELFLAARVCWH